LTKRKKEVPSHEGKRRHNYITESMICCRELNLFNIINYNIALGKGIAIGETADVEAL